METEPLLGASQTRDNPAIRRINRLSSVTGYQPQEEDDHFHEPITNDGDNEVPADETTILQACVFLEDAEMYRSINHRVDKASLTLYRSYYTPLAQWVLYIVIFVLHMLAFIEYPSSLTKTSDMRERGKRTELQCGITESIEIICLIILLCDASIKVYVRGWRQMHYSKWLVAYLIIASLSIVDWFVTVASGGATSKEPWCHETLRIRRMLRPFFILQNSSIMKKTVNCLRRTLPQVFSVLVLLFTHVYFFTLFGMLLFPKTPKERKIGNDTDILSGSESLPHEGDEQNKYFRTLGESFMSLLVLLTTANNPDVTLPAYNENRLYAIFFVIFLMIGLYCFQNMLTAVIFNQFRGYFLDSMQSSLFRRRLGMRAAYEVLMKSSLQSPDTPTLSTGFRNGISPKDLKAAVQLSRIRKIYKEEIIKELDSRHSDLTFTEYSEILQIMESDITTKRRPEIREIDRRWLKLLQMVFAHKYFTYLGCLIALGNVICISIELSLEFDHVQKSSHTYLGIFNFLFVTYYMFEQIVKLWALGWKRYTWEKGNIFDGIITFCLVVIEIIYLALYGVPYIKKHTEDDDAKVKYQAALWDLVRVINMLIMIRLLRMITHIKAMFIVGSTLLDLVKNLKAFAGILVVIYYSYALLGMELFQGKIIITIENNNTNKCGTYEQLEYWANNFDDFAAALIVLWDIMVVNNWMVFLDAYTRYVNTWAQLYFIVWWLISVVICLNLFTALILENFIMRWDRLSTSRRREESISGHSITESYRADSLTVHDMFRNDLQEPSEESLMEELHQLPHLQFQGNVLNINS